MSQTADNPVRTEPRPPEPDEWLRCVKETPAASGARGSTRGRIYRRDGRLAVRVVHEGLVRVVSTGS